MHYSALGFPSTGYIEIRFLAISFFVIILKYMYHVVSVRGPSVTEIIEA
jgi:hypothetical protein